MNYALEFIVLVPLIFFRLPDMILKRNYRNNSRRLI